MTRLIDVWRSGQITLSEYQSYLNLGYKPSDTVQTSSGRSAEMVTLSYMDLGSGRSFTLRENETMMGYIGSQSLTNAGTITNAGEMLFLYKGGKIVNTGRIVNTGKLSVLDIYTTLEDLS